MVSGDPFRADRLDGVVTRRTNSLRVARFLRFAAIDVHVVDDGAFCDVVEINERQRRRDSSAFLRTSSATPARQCTAPLTERCPALPEPVRRLTSAGRGRPPPVISPECRWALLEARARSAMGRRLHRVDRRPDWWKKRGQKRSKALWMGGMCVPRRHADGSWRETERLDPDPTQARRRVPYRLSTRARTLGNTARVRPRRRWRGAWRGTAIRQASGTSDR